MPHDPVAAYRRTLAGLLAHVSDDAPCRESARGEDHHWMVFTTYLQDVAIGVFCTRCGCDGLVQQPTRIDWQRAYDAPSSPYPWHHGRMVRFIGRRLELWRREVAGLSAGGPGAA